MGRHTINGMLEIFVRAISHVLVPMFLIGMAGSAVVVAITVVHDIHDFFADNGEESKSPDGLS
ncbi:hypothetical protein Terro_1608 [Terriglobus roseus DSM 18391]|uniref:Uncharacterized protein n=2 Tax=Terriglobus roseus TaxID=392734 RepID=I3ZF96_TERRK|nr:hypothetical protein Terro_1608 [Terriglobus roseus DSM 18391]